jgi:hypothetical protein
MFDESRDMRHTQENIALIVTHIKRYVPLLAALSMLYLILAVLLAAASLMLDIASAWGKAVDAARTGSVVGGTSILPGVVFFPATGCGLAWLIERAYPGYALWIIGVPVLLVALLAFGFYLRCRYLVRSKARMS